MMIFSSILMLFLIFFAAIVNNNISTPLVLRVLLEQDECLKKSCIMASLYELLTDLPMKV